MQCIYFLAVAICQLIQRITGFQRWGKKCSSSNDVLDLHENNSDGVKVGSQFDLEIRSEENHSDKDHFQPDRQTTIRRLRNMVNRAVLTHDALHHIEQHHEQYETHNSLINDGTVAAFQPNPNVRHRKGISTIQIEVDEIKQEMKRMMERIESIDMYPQNL